MADEGTTQCTFLVSVASGDIDKTDDDYVAGESYDVPTEKADEFILKGYAKGELSRPYDDDEVSALMGQIQAISFGGSVDVFENAKRAQGSGN